MISTFKFFIGSVNFGTVLNYSINRQSRIMLKLLDKELKNQKNGNVITKLAQEVFPAPNQGLDRRLSALNKVYMQYITEVMQMEKYSSQLVNLGIEVSKVKILKDHSYINVYWISKNDNLNKEKVQNILNKSVRELQKDICSLRHIGKLPELRFVRDVVLEKQLKVERLLSVIDFGKDYEPSKPHQAFNSGSVVETDGNIPEMRQDVLGLDHAKIKGRILIDIGKSKIIDLPEKEFEFKNINSRNLIPFDKITFAKFYRRRQILKKKMQKNMNHYNYEDDNLNDDRENEFLNEYWNNEEFEEKEELHSEGDDFHTFHIHE